MSEARLFQGDCLVLMKELGYHRVQWAITDPPYGIGISKSGHVGGGSEKNPATRFERKDWDDTGLTPEQFAELRRVAREQLIFGFEHLAGVLGQPGSVFVWDKKLRNDWDTSFADGETAWVSRDEPLKIYRHLWQGMYRASEQGEERLHPTQKPVAVMRWVIEHYTQPGDWILDPFMGSGTTCVAALETGRNCIGMERDPAYFAIAQERVARAERQPILLATVPTATQASLFGEEVV